MRELHSRTAWFHGLWFTAIPVRLYWNWKQFSLRRQGRTCESSAHVLELKEGLSRWRVLLCIVCGSHDYENQRAGRVRKNLCLLINWMCWSVYMEAHVQHLQGRDYWIEYETEYLENKIIMGFKKKKTNNNKKCYLWALVIIRSDWSNPSFPPVPE